MCHAISLIRFILKDVLNRWYIYIYSWFTALRGLWLPTSVHKSNTYHAGLSPVIYLRSVNVSKHVLKKVCRTFTRICPLPLFKSDKANKLLNVTIYTNNSSPVIR